MLTQHTTKRARRHIAVLMSSALIGLLALAGCYDSSTNPEETAAIDAAISDLTIEEVMEKVQIDAEQAAALEPLLKQLRQQQRSGDNGHSYGYGHGEGLSMLADAADVLDQQQMVALVELFAEKQQERMQQRRSNAQQNCEPGAEQKRMGRRGPQGGQPGRMGRGGPQGPHGQDRGGLLSELDLSAEQLAALEAAREEMRPARQALREQMRNGELTREQMRTAMQALRDQMHATIAGILTAEQNAQLAELRDARILAHLESALERRLENATDRLALVARVLQLEESQLAAATTLHESAATEMAAIVEALRSGQTTGAEARQAVQDLREQTLAAFRELLTTEQQELFDALQALRHHGRRGGPGGPGCR